MTSDRGTSGGAELKLNHTPVTPKSPALNPNASVFLSVKTSTPGAGPTETGQFEANDSGIANSTSSVSDYSYVNGDISTDKSDTGVFSPTSDSPFQSEFNAFTDNQNFNDTNSTSAAMKLEETTGNMMVDTGGFVVDAPPAPTNFSTDTVVPMTGIQYSSENGSATDGETTDSCSNVPDDQLRHVLKNQLESYFSRENLSNDSYLQSQMDADQYVPIATVANLDQIQKLTSDMQIIVELLRESTFVQVDDKGEKVRPNHNRCIVILREIPDATPVQDVQALFSGVNCPKFVSCEFAHNSNWYVTFDSDADAQRAYQYLREDVRTFLGKPIMARIKAKPLIRTYQPRNGYLPVSKCYQQPQQVTPQIPPEVVTSSAPQPQFTATQPFTLMPTNVSQYLNGQQAIPFYPPPPSQLLQTWPSQTMLDPSMVLAMNGYQATNVNVNSQVNNRTMFNRTSNNNTRNQKQHIGSGQSMGRDRINSNDSLPPRLQHQQHERQQNSANNMHKTSQPISNHAPVYQARRTDTSHSNHSSHHSHHGNHSHPAHPTQLSHPHHHQHQPPQPLVHHQAHHPPPPPPLPPQQQHPPQHLDGNNNSSNISNDAPLNSRNSQAAELLSQRYPGGKSYKSRRRREEDGARPNRSNTSLPSQRDGLPLNQTRSLDKYDYEPTSFPPLPGSGNNASSGDVFESKLSDVVKGTAKPQVKEVPKPVSPISAVSTATTTVTTSKPNMSSCKDIETTPSFNQHPSGASPSSPDCAAKMVVGTLAQQPTVSQPVRSSANTVQTVPDSQAGREADIRACREPELRACREPELRTARETEARACREPESQTSKERPSQQQQQQSNTDDNTASLSANSVKLSYAQMVQKTKVAEVSANSLIDESEESDAEDADMSQAPNRALKEQGQHPTQSSSKPSAARGSNKDLSRKDSRESESDSRRDDRDREFRKENDFRREVPREHRVITRRFKENRERRFGDRDFGRDRDFARRPDRRGPDGLPLRERDGPRPTAAK